MEENNNDEKTLVDKGKEFVKNKTKNGAKKLFIKLLPKILPVIGMFFLILLAAGLLLATQKLIQDVFDSILGIFDSPSSAKVNAVYSSNILEAAQQVHDEQMDWEYYDRTNSKLKGDIESALNNEDKVTCCSTYVSSVLYVAGYFTEEEMNTPFYDKISFNSPIWVDLKLDKSGWNKITDEDELEPGDIICMQTKGDMNPDHVQIYAGNGQWYNAGMTYYIQTQAPYTNENWTKDCIEWWAYRANLEPQNDPVERTTEDYKGHIISVEEDGSYKLNAEDLSKQILEELENQKVNNEVMGFDVEELGNLIDKYIEAEVKTSYPKTNHPQSDIDGMIVIKRASGNTGNVIELKYKSYKEFCNKVNSGNVESLEEFSINPETLKLCIAKQSQKIEYVDFNGNKTESISSIKIEEIDYQKYIQNHITSVNFLVTLHLISQNTEFMEDVLEIALNEGGIELTYVDTASQTVTQYDYTGEITYSYTPELTEEQKEQLPEDEKQNKKEIDNSNVGDYYEAKHYQEIITTYKGKIYVTNADTWLTSASKKINTPPISTTGSPNAGEPTVVKSEQMPTETIKITEPATGQETTVNRERYIKIEEIITTSTTNTRYTISTKEKQINVDKFIELIKKYPKVENNFTTASNNLFYFLQQSEKTQEHEKIMRFVLYKLTNISYGVTEEDLNCFSDDFKSVSEGYKETIETKIWFELLEAGYSEFAVSGIMGNLAEYSFKSNNLADDYEIGGEYSIDYTDETYTKAINDKTYTKEQFCSDQAGYGLAQWKTEARKSGLYEFAKEQETTIDDEDMQIKYLIKDLEKYQDDNLVNAGSPEEASKAYYICFENPEGTEEETKSIEEKARKYYEQYDGKTRESLAAEHYPEGTKLIYNGLHFFPEFDQLGGDYLDEHYGGSTLHASGCGAFTMASIISGLLGDPSVDAMAYRDFLEENGVYSGSGCGYALWSNSAALEKEYGLSSKPSNIYDIPHYTEELNGECAWVGFVPGHIVAVVPAVDDSDYLFYVVDSADSYYHFTGGYTSGEDFRDSTGYTLTVWALIY